jgi:prolyl-tRNA synthetase
MASRLTDRTKDFSGWYQDIIDQAGLAEHGPVKGTMIIKPYGYAIWELIQAELDRRIKATGVVNAYFPLFIPKSFLEREKAHVEGFSPELAVVTHAGGQDLTEPVVIRPTSETVMYDAYSRWIKSYRDLPLLLNQWCNVVRWELRTRLFLRTSEFLWQEGHTAHATEEDAEERTKQMLEVYRAFVEDVLAIPLFVGQKTDTERFAGALRTYAIEAMMGDGKALQMGTSHNLGQHFAKVFNVQFLDEKNTLQYAWQTSWGVSTRMIGGVIMVHGDERGLALPPRIAPVQVVIVPIGSDEAVIARAQEIRDELAALNIRVRLDARTELTPGFKFNEWEVKGVPVRLELGPKDVAAKHVVLVRRDSGEKATVGWDSLAQTAQELLESIQQGLFGRAQKFQQEHIMPAASYDEFKTLVESKPGFIHVTWCGDESELSAIKEETKATSRVLPFDQSGVSGKCFYCGKQGKRRIFFAKAY